MNPQPAAQHTPRSRQRGMASIIAVVFLIAGVIYILSQTMGIVGTRSADTTQQLDSTAALALAESGLERAQAVVGTAASAGTLTANDCTGLATGGPFALGRGDFSYTTLTPEPEGCNSAGGTPCDSCSVGVKGTVNSASRTLNQIYNFTQAYGTTGRGFTVTMVLKNIHPVPAMALFHLAWQRQGPGGNANATICADCGNRWTVESSSGNPSVGAMGVTVPIAPLTYSQVVTQYLSLSRDYVEVGALFPSTVASGTTTFIGSYWDDASGGGTGTKTVNNSGNVGQVNSGVVAASSGTCVASPTAGTEQTCNSWCYGGDTLVYGFAGRSASVANEVSAVTFDTGASRQNIPMTRVVHFPDTGGATLNASGTLYSEVWWAYNPDYLSGAGGAGATSYPRAVQGSIGAIFDASFRKTDASRMTVTNVISGTLNIGDSLPASSNIDSTVTITAVPSPGPTGVYTFSGPVYVGSPGNYSLSGVNIASTKLAVSGVTSALTTGATNNGVTIASGPDGLGNYTVATPTTRSTQIFTQGTSGSTITVPTGSALPAVGTLLAVHSVSSGGAGAFAAGTTVTAVVGANAFTVSTAPAPGSELAGATICGGTCAFFNGPSSTSSVTNFSVAASANTSQWGSGFTCLKGVDPALIAPVTSTTVKPGRWQESVQ